MGIHGISPLSLLLILAIMLLLFGPKRLSDLGQSLGGALRQFRDAVQADDSENQDRKS